MSNEEVEIPVPSDSVQVNAEPNPGGDYEKELEDLFKDRYTESDEIYMNTVKKDLPHPPCVENWYSRPKRNFDWARGGRGGGGYGNQGRHQSHHRGHGQGHSQWRDHGRHRDHRQEHHNDHNRVFYPRVKHERGSHRQADSRYQPYGQSRDSRQGYQRNDR